MLRIPANYLTPFGLSAPARETVTYVALVMFFPNLEGYTPTNWRDVETSKDAVFVFIKRASGVRSASTAAPCDAKLSSSTRAADCRSRRTFIRTMAHARKSSRRALVRFSRLGW
jgi:hypothetical protein